MNNGGIHNVQNNGGGNDYTLNRNSNGMNSSMEDYNFNSYQGMEYSEPVDVEATLNSLLTIEPSYDFFGASLLSHLPPTPSSSLSASSPATPLPLLSSSNPSFTLTPAPPPSSIVPPSSITPPSLNLTPSPHSPALSPSSLAISPSRPPAPSPSSLTPSISHMSYPPSQTQNININNNITTINLHSSNNIPLLPPPPNQPAYSLSLTPSTTSLSLTSSTSSHLDPNRKRARKDEIVSEEISKGFDWNPFQSSQMTYIIYDSLTRQPLGDSLDMVIYQSGTNMHISSNEKAWIFYRQNQFKIICLLKTPQVSMFLRDGAVDVEVTQFYVKLYAIISTPMGIREEVQVGLFHVGKSRVKKEKTEIVAVPFVDGRTEFTHLQFERSNAAKRQEEYFHLVVTLYAKNQNICYPILSKISPKIVVRGQHPGFYNSPSPTEQNTQESNNNNLSANNTSSEGSTSPKIFENEQVWQQNGDILFHMGKVGINTSDPTEALTVHGNAIITGNLFTPSDQRLKHDFTPVDPNEQLDHIRNLQIYDYKIQERKQRGVIAQELQAVMPPAVHCAGDMYINGQTVPDLLVVNERSLLYENIGATQQLDKHLEREKVHIIQIDERVEDLSESTQKVERDLKHALRSLWEILFAEETYQGEANSPAWQEEQVVFGVNLFRMGPARSFMVLGYFCSYAWLVGALYVFSNVQSRQILGRACILKFVVWWGIYITFLIGDALPWATLVYSIIGMNLLLGNWRRNKRRMEMRRQGREEELRGSGTKGWNSGWKCWDRFFLDRKQGERDEEEGAFRGKEV